MNVNCYYINISKHTYIYVCVFVYMYVRVCEALKHVATDLKNGLQ